MANDASDWDLEQAVRFDSRLLAQGDAGEQQVGALIMSLALTFNDLKDLLWWSFKLRPYEPAEPSAKVAGTGQYYGMVVHISRLEVGLLHELLEALDKNKEVCEQPLFTQAEAGLTRSFPKAWQDWQVIKEVAGLSGGRVKGTDNARFRQSLGRVRKIGEALLAVEQAWSARN